MMPPILSQLHMGKQAEEQQKFGERVSGLWARGALRTCSRLLRFCLCITLALVLLATPLSPWTSSSCARLSEPCCRLCFFPPCSPHSWGSQEAGWASHRGMALWRCRLQGGAVWGYWLSRHLLPALLVF